MKQSHPPVTHASFRLPDGRDVEFELRRSPRARWVYLRMDPRDGLVITAPRRLGYASVLRVMSEKSRWIANRLSEFEAVRHLVDRDATTRPEAFELPALGESWRVHYSEAPGSAVRARTGDGQLIVATGAVQHAERCRLALRRWLARRAADALPPWLAALARHAGLEYRAISIRSQRARWGSCSVGGHISLNCKLLFLPRELAEFVMIHELCHLLEANHSRRFWSHVRRLEPATDALRRQMRHAWKWVPAWAD